MSAEKTPVSVRRKLTDSQVASLSYQLEVAREIQTFLLPKRLPQVPGYDFDAAYDPAEDIAGDYYDFFPHDKGEQGFLIADACGKGIPAALIMVHARGLMRTVVRGESQPADILRQVNAMLMRDLKPGTFVTAQYVKLIPARRKLMLSSAGHLPLLLVREKTGECLAVQAPGMPLGVGAPPMFDRSLEQVSVLLEPGDRFVMFTDGANEMRDPQGEEFGMEAFKEVVRQHARLPSSDFTALVLAAIRDFRKSARRMDDVTLVTGRFLPTGA